MSLRFAQRLARLRARLDDPAVEALLITTRLNVRYLSGFTGSAGSLLIGRDFAVLLTDRRYTLRAQREASGFEVVVPDNPDDDILKTQLETRHLRRVGFEANHVTVKTLESWQEKYQELGVEWVATDGVVEELRQVKDGEEIAAIREACGIADAAFRHIQLFMQPETVELDVAMELDFYMRRQGARRAAFDIIVASGENSAMPHAETSERRFRPGDFVILDYGAEVDGYCSDITRTVVIGKASEEQRRMYHTVLEAQLRAIEAIKPGVKGCDVDSVARQVISDAGYGDHFTHSLGHSLGLSVHDGIGFAQKSEVVLEPGMVFTVEPGIYIEGVGGVRIEDDILVTEEGCEVLTHAPKELMEFEAR
ncbi:MAG: Xaa-Pro peptidase family protein [bacterium]|nr:Xaa-Pro peptidase family protein [bacterium]